MLTADLELNIMAEFIFNHQFMGATQCSTLLVLQAMGATWHPECFTCEMCNKELADLGFVKNQGRALCHECNAKVRSYKLQSLSRPQ